LAQLYASAHLRDRKLGQSAATGRLAVSGTISLMLWRSISRFQASESRYEHPVSGV